MVSIKDISYRNLPNQSELFLQYLESSESAMRFFQHAPVLENLERDLPDEVRLRKVPRNEILPILRRQNEGYGCTPQTRLLINELESPDCVAIVTGQQAGIFCGPLYTIYKALTAVHLSEKLRSLGIRAVPVFWIESEDHDLAEVARQTLLTRDDTVRVDDYREILFGKDIPANRPVGSIRFPDAIRDVVRNFADCLPDSRWKAGIRSTLDSTYCPGSTFSQSFARLMVKILEGTGLILFDPRDPPVKPLLSHVFQWALEKLPEIQAALLERNRALASAGFHSQVSVTDSSTVLFLIEDGHRHALEKSPSGFRLKNGSREFSLRQLLDMSQESPEKFSPNVLLRPIIQDTLFPTLAYIGGPAEIAYFAQVETLYALRKLPMPVIWPRESFTLMDSGIRKAMHRLGIDILDCFEGIHILRRKAFQNTIFHKTDGGLEEMRKSLENTFSDIREEAERLDPSLPRALATARRKILHNIERIESRIAHIEWSRDASVFNTAGLLLNHCLPNRNLQERELSIHHFLSLHGPALLDEIRSGIGKPGFFHHVLQLE